MAFFTASVKDEKDATCWIGLFGMSLLRDEPSESAADFVGNAEDEELLVDSDKCFMFANGVQRLEGSAGEVGAKKRNEEEIKGKSKLPS